MGSTKAFFLMGLLTSTVAASLYLLDAHLYYRELAWALGLSIVLLATHLANMVIYFRIAGDKPYKWFD